ncbi:hypothetical protein AVEN_243578-1 [Araneus ventricosus]|uniref:Uncharacterized protein n=1 Tax=Araneus ventricosus TaxID=182803 RepID=A0A4Y2A631_ARAVE|nr:hypothetical protein AVEN_243578-1 [Araneus ventricosus]
MNSIAEISVQHRFNAANELFQRVTQTIFQFTMIHPSRRPHIASLTQYSLCPFSPDDFFHVGLFEIQDLFGEVPSIMTLKDNISLAVLSIPGDMLRLAFENAVCRMQCVIHEKSGHVERGQYIE